MCAVEGFGVMNEEICEELEVFNLNYQLTR